MIVSARGVPAPEASGAASSSDYDAATVDAAFIDRSDRARLALRGRAPDQVLTGLVSGRVPSPLTAKSADVWQGRAEGSALLTPKGRMVAVLRVLRAEPSAGDGFLLDIPPVCLDAALEHLRKYVPPRLATLHDESSASGMLTLLGPRATGRLVELVGRLDLTDLNALRDGDLLRSPTDQGDLTVVRTAEVATPAFDVFGSSEAVSRVRDAMATAGLSRVSGVTWDVLRVEAGSPEFGVDMDDATIPVEAGIQGRVVDYEKGCFTGQEVLIRIRDRGHVNRILRGLRFGAGAAPESGAQLFLPNEERAVGHVTSAVRSPRFGEVIGLGYVRREVTPPSELRVGSPSGSPLRVESLQESWRPAGSP